MQIFKQFQKNVPKIKFPKCDFFFNKREFFILFLDFCPFLDF